MEKEIKRIKTLISIIQANEIYSTGFIINNRLFIKEAEVDKKKIRQHLYYLIYSGFIKTKLKIPIGVSKQKVFEIKGSELIKALNHYYNL